MKHVVSAALIAAGLVAGAASVASAGERVETSGKTYHVAVCPRLVPNGFARCHAHVVTDSRGAILRSRAGPNLPAGYGPSDLRSAYNVSTGGSSSTIIAIVDAFGYANAERDLGVYRTTFGLPACTTANGCFTKYNQKGQQGNYPPDNVGWAQETALDLDMASAMCPNCKIILVEGKTNSFKSLAKAVDTAAAKGAHVISNSYGGGETGGAAFESHYNHPGVSVTASSGDSGYGTAFPATSPHVVAVGGTSLDKDLTAPRGWAETAWSGAGSGCSVVFAKPSWQTDTGCPMRMEADVSAVSDPNTGVAVYAPVDSTVSAFQIFGGTSVAAPLIGGVYGANGGPVNYGSDPYAHTGALYDVTKGSNGPCPNKPAYFCNAKAGYDGPTGLGTPNGITAF